MTWLRAQYDRVISRTVWAPEAIPPEEWDYRNVPRVWLPLYDLTIMLAGLVGAINTMPALDLIFDPWIVDIMAGFLVFTALLCLIGVVFRGVRVEAYAKVALVGLIGSYSIALLALAAGDSLGRVFIGVLSIALLFLPFSRLQVLGAKLRRKEEAQKNGFLDAG